jgi:hypothetical protein
LQFREKHFDPYGIEVAEIANQQIGRLAEDNMNKVILAIVLVLGLSQSGCAFLGGAAVGSLATGAGYELNAHNQMDKLEADYRNERISRREYEARKAQIEKGSIIY